MIQEGYIEVENTIGAVLITNLITVQIEWNWGWDKDYAALMTDEELEDHKDKIKEKNLFKFGKLQQNYHTVSLDCVINCNLKQFVHENLCFILRDNN